MVGGQVLTYLQGKDYRPKEHPRLIELREVLRDSGLSIGVGEHLMQRKYDINDVERPENRRHGEHESRDAEHDGVSIGTTFLRAATSTNVVRTMGRVVRVTCSIF